MSSKFTRPPTSPKPPPYCKKGPQAPPTVWNATPVQLQVVVSWASGNPGSPWEVNDYAELAEIGTSGIYFASVPAGGPYRAELTVLNLPELQTYDFEVAITQAGSLVAIATAIDQTWLTVQPWNTGVRQAATFSGPPYATYRATS